MARNHFVCRIFTLKRCRFFSPLRSISQASLILFVVGLIAMPSITGTVCVAQQQSLMTRHVRDVVLNRQARLLGHLSTNKSMRLVIVLPLRHQPELEDLLQQLYDPSSRSYRHFLTVKEFTERFGPSQEDYDAVVRFAKTNGFAVVGHSRNRVNMDIVASVRDIEKAFHVTMGVYQHPTENRTFYAPDREPTVDLPLALWHIAGLENYSIPRPLLRKSSAGAKPNATTGSGPNESFLGSDMRLAYYGGSLTGTGQSLGLVEYVGTNLSDLNTYYANVGQTNNVPITIVSPDGTSTDCFANQGCDDTEQTLDMTQALGMAPGLSGLVMYVGSTDSAILNAMATASPLNAQLSCSWMWYPADPGVDDPYFQEFAAQGQSFFTAAGDSGTWIPYSYVYPADDAYVTSVGGTSLETVSAGGAWSSETTWVWGGGGISPDNILIPFWQATTASGCSSCSPTYRNGPDVSANADFTFYVCANQEACTTNVWGGTSFATPMWAGYMALANQLAIGNGNPPLGFINPALYGFGLGSSYNNLFHDISSGNNGYAATTGYDLATGWGSPNRAGLINALAVGLGPSFALAASPASFTVTPSNSATANITSTPKGGFNSAISLSATGQPAGVNISFNPSSITANGTSIMTITVGSSTAGGTHAITVTGTSGSTTEVAMVFLTVPVPLTSIAVTPATATVQLPGTVQFTATGNYSDGGTQDLTSTATWSSSNRGVATISASGLATAVAAGSTNMTASFNGIASNAATLVVQATVPAAAPTFSPGTGNYNTPQSLTLSDSTPGVSIYYTTNGSTPTTSSTLYTGPITVATTTTIKAVAAGNGYAASSVASALFVIQALAPSFSPGTGNYNSSQSVTLSDSTPGVSIYYTTNGSTPTTSSTLYTGPITVATTTTIKAIAAGNGYAASSVATGTYVISSK